MVDCVWPAHVAAAAAYRGPVCSLGARRLCCAARLNSARFMRKRRGRRTTIHRRRRFEAGELVHEHAGHLRRDAVAAAGARTLRHGAAVPPRHAMGATAASSYSCVFRGCVRHGAFVRDVRPRPFQAPAKRGAPGMVRRRSRAAVVCTGTWMWPTPVPFSVQGVVYLEDTMAEAGASVVPSCRGRLGRSTTPRPSRSRGDAVARAVAFGDEARSGSEHLDRPRVSAYVAMLPVDASPFLGDRPPDTACR